MKWTVWKKQTQILLLSRRGLFSTDLLTPFVGDLSYWLQTEDDMTLDGMIYEYAVQVGIVRENDEFEDEPSLEDFLAEAEFELGAEDRQYDEGG